MKSKGPKQHINQLKSQLINDKQKVAEKICPRCGNKLLFEMEKTVLSKDAIVSRNADIQLDLEIRGTSKNSEVLSINSFCFINPLPASLSESIIKKADSKVVTNDFLELAFFYYEVEQI